MQERFDLRGFTSVDGYTLHDESAVCRKPIDHQLNGFGPRIVQDQSAQAVPWTLLAPDRAWWNSNYGKPFLVCPPSPRVGKAMTYISDEDTHCEEIARWQARSCVENIALRNDAVKEFARVFPNPTDTNAIEYRDCDYMNRASAEGDLLEMGIRQGGGCLERMWNVLRCQPTTHGE